MIDKNSEPAQQTENTPTSEEYPICEGCGERHPSMPQFLQDILNEIEGDSNGTPSSKGQELRVKFADILTSAANLLKKVAEGVTQDEDPMGRAEATATVRSITLSLNDLQKAYTGLDAWEEIPDNTDLVGMLRTLLTKRSNQRRSPTVGDLLRGSLGGVPVTEENLGPGVTMYSVDVDALRRVMGKEEGDNG